MSDDADNESFKEGTNPLSFIRPGYEVLAKVLADALDQAQWGKGAERHGGGLADETYRPFDSQPVMEIAKRMGVGFPLGQAMKKIIESQQVRSLSTFAVRNELYGAIIYIAAAIMHIERETFDSTK